MNALAELTEAGWQALEDGPLRGAQSAYPLHARPPLRAGSIVLYKFKSKAAGDVIMLGPNGDQVMRLLGREPAAKGIFEIEQMPVLVAALERAVAADEAARKQAAEQGEAQGKGDGVSLRQRVWPLVEMLRRCHAAHEVVTWGT